MHNHITIYSSGIADIQRGYAIAPGEPTKLAISVHRDHLGDVLGSMNIYGPVTLVSPPVYAPQNEIAGNLEIKPESVIEDLAVKLQGAKVQIKRAGDNVVGTLLGSHQESERHEGVLVIVKHLAVLTDEGIARVAIRDIQRLHFEDAVVRQELDKALTRRIRTLKPDSTTLELTLRADVPDAEAIVQYTVPAAAWKISYRLREQSAGQYEFQGFAIVDNHTDEDWNDVMISVVTGEPITFSTDLAVTKLPARDHVNLVKARALGAKEVEEAMYMMAAPSPGAAGAAMYLDAGPTRGGSAARRSKAASATMDYMESASAIIKMDSADARAAETREVGDFALFTSQTPVTIGAHGSALVPIFQVDLQETRSVLYYKQKEHAERGFRAIEFTNTTTHSLGRGVCAVFAEDTFVGSCVLPATSPGGDALLVHALETGVRVQTEWKSLGTRNVGIRVTDGACILQKRLSMTAEYRIANLKDEPYTVVLDHEHCLEKPQLTAVARRAEGETPLEVASILKTGIRLRFNLQASERLDVIVHETKIASERVAIVETTGNAEQLKTKWLIDHLIDSNGPLSGEPALKAALAIEDRLNAKAKEISELVGSVDRLTQRQERLRKNIATGGQDEQTARWRVELGEAEQRINELEEQTLPRLRAEELAIRAELRAALTGLALEWKE